MSSQLSKFQFNSTSTITPQPTDPQSTSSSGLVAGDAVIPPIVSADVLPSSIPQPTNQPTDNLTTEKSVVNPRESSESILAPEILEAMGKRLDPDNQRASAIHKDIIVCWEDIIKKGLPEDERKNLFKKHLTPENCVIFEPPKLNAEIKASVLEPIISRDNKIVDTQRKVSYCLSTLGSMLSSLLKGATLDSLTLIFNLSDMGRILVDLQRDETVTRRLTISFNLNTSLKAH